MFVGCFPLEMSVWLQWNYEVKWHHLVAGNWTSTIVNSPWAILTHHEHRMPSEDTPEVVVARWLRQNSYEKV